MQYDILEELRKLATTLDDNGFMAQADAVDGFIDKIADDLGDAAKELQYDRTSQIDRQVAEQMDGGPAASPEFPGGLPEQSGSQRQAFTADELTAAMDTNPAFKRAMLMKLQEEIKNFYTTPEELAHGEKLQAWLAQYGESLTSAQISEYLGQFGFLRPE